MKIPYLYLSMRYYALFLLFSVSLLASAGDLKIYTSGGLQGVADEEGKVVVPAIYEKLGWSNGKNDIINQTIGFYENGSWGLINIKTRKIESARYKVLEPFNGQLFEAGKVTHYSNVVKRGLIDDKGDVILGFNYFTIDELAEDRYKVSEYTNNDILFGMVGSEEVFIPIIYESLNKVGSLVEVWNKGMKRRLYSLDGQDLVNGWIDHVDLLSDGYVITNEGYQGKLDAHGRLILEIKYKSITDQEVIPFPSWQVSELDLMGQNQNLLEIACDSITHEPIHNLLIAHVNNAEHILAASDLLFTDQQNSLKSIRNGFLITKNRKLQQWGIYKTDGREVAAGFDSVAVDSLYFFTNSKGDWDVYNLFGRKMNERPFQELGFASNRNIPAKRNGYWGWLDFRGNVMLNYTFEKVQKSFSTNHFLAKNYGKWGVKSFSDDWLILSEYDSIYDYDQFYIATKGEASYIFNELGEVIHSLPYQALPAKGYLQLVNGDKVGAITSLGHYIHPQYDQISVHDAYYEMQDSSGATLVHVSGRQVLKAADEVEDVLGFSEGFFHIIKDGKHGFVDENGKLRVANRYDSAQAYHEGLAPVMLLGKWGFIDKYEILQIQPFYRYSSTFKNGLAIIQTGEDYGIITPSGKEVVDVKWKQIERLPTDNYKVIDWDNKVGICDVNGRFIVRPNYTEVVDTDRELLIVTSNGAKGLIDYQGYTKLPFDYNQIEIKGDYLLLQKKGD